MLTVMFKKEGRKEGRRERKRKKEDRTRRFFSTAQEQRHMRQS
jgi:hypothetical protein